MNHLALVFGFIGHLVAIRAALAYDLTDLPMSEHQLTGAAARLWKTNMNAWEVTHSHP